MWIYITQRTLKPIIMKTFTFLPTLLIIFVLCLSNCSREGCTDPASDNFDANAEVDNGTCIPMVEKFLGLYSVEEVCETGIYSYPMSAYASFDDPFEIIITNYGDLGIDVIGVVDFNFIYIPDQFFRLGQDNIAILSGEGEILNGVLSIRYLYEQNGALPVQCRIDAVQ